MSPKTSHDIAGRKPRNDTERQTREATIADAGENDGKDRDLVHGEGGTINIRAMPEDLSKAD